MIKRTGVMRKMDLLHNLLLLLPSVTEQFGSDFHETAVLSALESMVMANRILSTSLVQRTLMSGFEDSLKISEGEDLERFVNDLIMEAHPSVEGWHWVVRPGSRAALRLTLKKK